MTTLVTGVPDTRTINGKPLTGDLVLTAGEVGVEELPLPDVWLPLTSDLRLRTGSGTNIMSGGTAVATVAEFTRPTAATYIDKTGVLRVAAINEPRFEKEGLLVESQSTNLYATSTSMSHNVIFAGTGSFVPDACWPGHLGQTFTEDTTDAYHRVDIDRFCDFTADQELTASVVIKVVGGKSVVRLQTDAAFPGLGSHTISCKFNLATGQSAVSGSNAGFTNSRCALRPLSDGWFRLEWTFTPRGTITRRPLRVSLQANYNVDSSSHIGNPSDGFTITTPQVEALPFATSYIPTSGAAVTRGVDNCHIPLTNMEVNSKSFTVAGSFDSMGYDNAKTPYSRLFQLGGETPSGDNLRVFRGSGNVVSIHGAGTLGANATQSYADGVIALAYHSATSFATFIGGTYSLRTNMTPWTVANPLTRIGIGSDTLGSSNRAWFGHIRNFRIWNIPFTESQLKGIK